MCVCVCVRERERERIERSYRVSLGVWHLGLLEKSSLPDIKINLSCTCIHASQEKIAKLKAKVESLEKERDDMKDLEAQMEAKVKQ